MSKNNTIYSLGLNLLGGNYVGKTGSPAGLFTYVNRTSIAGTNGGTTPSINTTGVNIIVVEVGSYYPTGEPTLSDNKSNIWIPLTRHFDPLNTVSNRIFYCINPTVGAGHTFTLTGATSYSNMNVLCFNNTINSIFLNENGAGDIGNFNYLNTGNVTNTLDNALVIVGFTGLNTGTPPITIDSGIIQADSYYNGGIYIAGTGGYKILSGITTTNVRFDWNNQTYTACSIAIFQ